MYLKHSRCLKKENLTFTLKGTAWLTGVKAYETRAFTCAVEHAGVFQKRTLTLLLIFIPEFNLRAFKDHIKKQFYQVFSAKT